MKTSHPPEASGQRPPKSSRSDSSLSPNSSDAEDEIEVETKNKSPARDASSMTPTSPTTPAKSATTTIEPVVAQEVESTAPPTPGGTQTSSSKRRPRRSEVAELLEPPTKRSRKSNSQLADTPAGSPAKRAAKGKSKAESAPPPDVYPVGTLGEFRNRISADPQSGQKVG